MGCTTDSEVTEVISGEGTFTVSAEMKKRGGNQVKIWDRTCQQKGREGKAREARVNCRAKASVRVGILSVPPSPILWSLCPQHVTIEEGQNP